MKGQRQLTHFFSFVLYKNASQQPTASSMVLFFALSVNARLRFSKSACTSPTPVSIPLGSAPNAGDGAGADAGDGDGAGADAGDGAGSDASDEAGSDAGDEAGADAGDEAGADVGADAGADAVEYAEADAEADAAGADAAGADAADADAGANAATFSSLASEFNSGIIDAHTVSEVMIAATATASGVNSARWATSEAAIPAHTATTVLTTTPTRSSLESTSSSTSCSLFSGDFAVADLYMLQTM